METFITEAWYYASGEAEAESIRRQDKRKREMEAHVELDASLIKSGIELDSPAAAALHALISKAFEEGNQ